MKEYLYKFLYIHIAEEHRNTRLLMALTSLAMGCSIAGILHGLGVHGF